MAKTIADLAPNPGNPRKITEAKKATLARALAKFGDLGGVVMNLTSGQLVGGHQRCQAWAAEGATVTITKTYNPPTKVGTTAEGYIEAMGERFAYREVRWPPGVEKAANIAANNHASTWDMPALASIMADLRFDDIDLDETMFGIDERDKLFGEALKSIDEGVKEDSSKNTMCPACGHEF